MRMSKISSFTSAEINRWIAKHLHDDFILTTDGYRPFSRVCEVADQHHSINTEGIYNDSDTTLFHWVNIMIGNVKRAILGTYHSVSSKHLPRYLAEFSFRFNNRFLMGSMIDIILTQATQTNPLPHHKLKLAEEWG